MRRLTLIALVCCAACATTTAPSTAIPPTTVRVLRTARAEATVRALSTKPYLRLEVEGVEAVLAARAADAPAEEPGAIRTRGQANIQRARAAYRALRFEEALGLLAQTQGEIASVAREPADFELLAQITLLRGINLLAAKQDADAHQAFATAFHLGYRGPTAGEYAPEVEKRIHRIREDVASTSRNDLLVKSHPPGEVWVDGQRRGRSPVAVQVAPGAHHVRVEHVGFQSKAFFQLVGVAKPEHVEVSLRAASSGELARQLARGMPGSEELARLPADVVRELVGSRRALIDVDPAPLEARLLWTGEPPQARPCSGPSPAALADCLAPLLYECAAGRPPRPAPPPPSATPVYRRWWFWTLIAGGVVAATGAGVGIYYGTRDPGGYDVHIVSAK